MGDFKTNEYASLIGGAAFEPQEENPMLGVRGASRYYSPRYREGFALECRVIRRLRQEIGFKNVIIMIPFCRSTKEADRVLDVMAANGLKRGEDGLEVYVMCEIPSNVILAKAFAERFDGFSIGSNDLTQLTLGVDRDSEELAELFDEQDEAVMWMIRNVIAEAWSWSTMPAVSCSSMRRPKRCSDTNGRNSSASRSRCCYRNVTSEHIRSIARPISGRHDPGRWAPGWSCSVSARTVAAISSKFTCNGWNIDVVADYAFLVMDLMARGRTDLAYVFLNRYLEIAGDYDGVTLLPLYLVYRSLVRAKVAGIRRRERGPGERSAEDRHTIEHYCELAQAFAVRRPSTLILMTGLSGSGKTWLSSRLVEVLPALRLRSDLERKRLFGLVETADSHSAIASGIYSRDADETVNQRMFDCAAAVLDAGFDVILDTAFLDSAHRERARQVAAARGARFAVVTVVAPEPVLRTRLRQRAAAGADASEADLDVLEYQLGNAEPLTSDELRSTVTVNTDAEVDVASVVTGIREIAAAA
jgi:predicted kinase